MTSILFTFLLASTAFGSTPYDALLASNARLVTRSTDSGTDCNDTSVGCWSIQEQKVTPACRVTPNLSKDVSIAVAGLAKLKCQFAVRGGGHMFWAGSANIQDGVTIDLSSFTDVTVSGDHKTTSAGGGTRWRAIYSKLDVINLTIVGGRVFDVEIGGLTLGGGNSWFASRYGFACDNIANLEVEGSNPKLLFFVLILIQVVLAYGDIVNANASGRPDLFKALKGGGDNFGIVTRFDFKTFEQGPFWGGFLVLPTNNTMTQLEFVQNFTITSGAGIDDFAAIESIHAYNATGPTALAAIIIYTKPLAYPAIFKNLTYIQPQVANDLGITNLLHLTTEAGAGIGNGGRYVWATGTFPNNATVLAKVNELPQKAFNNITAKNGNFTFGNSFQSIPMSITGKAAATGENVLGLDPADGNVIWSNFNAQYFNDADEAVIEHATQKYIDSVNKYTKSIGQFKPFLYMNYAYPTQDVINSYGKENVDFLVAVSKRYDPMQVFQKLVPGGFKLKH